MGMMDFVMSLFGVGACKMEVKLDAAQVPVGGILSGKAVLLGGARPYPVNSVNVKLLYVLVESQPDSALPKIDTRILVDNAVATNAEIAANGRNEYEFTLQIPGGTEPTAHNCSYQVLVTADIPGLKDPSAKADLKVVEAAEGAPSLDLGAIYARWPALKGTAEHPLAQAIRDLGYAHNEWDETANLRIAEPILAKFLRHESEHVRHAALEAWSRVIGDEASKENLATLKAYLQAADPEGDEVLAALEAAGRFGKCGGIDLLEPFATHPREEIRERVARAVGWHARDVGKGLILLQKMADDASVHVRAQVIDSLAEFDQNAVVMKRLAELAQDPSTPVAIRRKLPYGLRRSWKFPDVVWPGIRALAKDEDHEVRRMVADVMSSYSEAAGAADVIRALLGDREADVRKAMAFELINFPEEALAAWRKPLETLAETDPEREVRTNAIASLSRGRPVDEVVGYYRGWMTKDPSEAVLRGIVHGIKFQEDPKYKAILKELSGCPYPQVAKEARDGFEFSTN